MDEQAEAVLQLVLTLAPQLFALATNALAAAAAKDQTALDAAHDQARAAADALAPAT